MGVNQKMIVRIALALVLSVSLVVLLGFLYTFYPLIFAMLSSLRHAFSSNPAGTGGITAVAGGLSSSFLISLLLLEPFLFFIIFAVLQRRSQKKS